MLSKILSKTDCAKCKFCCSFRRQSLWETPIFSTEQKNTLLKKYPFAKFKSLTASTWTIDLDNNYKTDDAQEEAKCYFLNETKGCILSIEEKPFDCSIWPLRAIKKDDKTIVALTPTCPAINKLSIEQVKSVVSEGLGEKILQEAQKNPDMVKPYKAEFIEL